MAKTLEFAGYTWRVNGAGTYGPGPNLWNPDNAWVDDAGRLHLKIAKQGDKWSCAELTTTKALGFGTYEFDVDGQAETLDDSVVLGLFNYPTPDIGPDGTNEIDIEFATWGGQQQVHGNYTVWPAHTGPKQKSQMFDFKWPSGHSRNIFTWTSKSVAFSWEPIGKPINGATDQLLPASEIGHDHWTYAPDDYLNSVPQQPLPVHINLWLFNGKPPTDDKEVEIVVSGFKFTPLGD